MNKYRADLHIHTVLSPCGSLSMSPTTIVEKAKQAGINILGITDHNSMRQCQVVREIGAKAGIMVLSGVEITTHEEAHCLAFFEKTEDQQAFQEYLDIQLPNIQNDTNRFGHQVWVDEMENILGEEERLLLSALSDGVDQIAAEVKKRNGIFIAAHIDRPSFSIISQLGFITPDIPFDALEISVNCQWDKLISKHPYLNKYNIFTSSDAHLPELIGTSTSTIECEALTFDEVQKAIRGEAGRSIKPEKMNIASLDSKNLDTKKMKDLSMHIMDIAQNSSRANATLVKISINEQLSDDLLSIQITDNGCGMDAEMVKKVSDPFFTSRTTRKVGLGIPLLMQNAETTGGNVTIESEVGVGTTLVANFKHTHIDRPPWGDIGSTIALLITGNPDVDYSYSHQLDEKHFKLDSSEIKKELEGIPLHRPEVFHFIVEMINENLKEMKVDI